MSSEPQSRALRGFSTAELSKSCSLVSFGAFRPRSGRLEFGLLNDRGAVEGNSRGSHAGKRSEPACDPRNRQPPCPDRGAVALYSELEATQAVRTSIMGQRSKAYGRGRGIDRSAVAESKATVSRKRPRSGRSPLRGSIALRLNSHGLRRGLRFFRTCSAPRNETSYDENAPSRRCIQDDATAR